MKAQFILSPVLPPCTPPFRHFLPELSFPHCPLGSFAFVPVLIPPPHKPKQNENSPVSKWSVYCAPDYQRYLPLSGRERPPKGLLGSRDRAQVGTERGSGSRGCGRCMFPGKALAGVGGIHLRLGEVETPLGPSRQAGSHPSPQTLPRKIKEQCVCFLTRV